MAPGWIGRRPLSTVVTLDAEGRTHSKSKQLKRKIGIFMGFHHARKKPTETMKAV
jgi:hypothetical protein